MCGLIGRFNFHGHVLPLSLNPLHHRGPDSCGSWFSHDRRCWLGHTRLAIQDPFSGQQPITSHCGRYTLVFNGEIYNHMHLRKALRFHAWRGHSDSETLVEGLSQKGPAFLLEMRGMFAFAAYDRDKQQLLLARDRLGIKPLYFSWEPDGLLFSSERRAIPRGQQLEPQLISHVLAFGHACTPADFPCPNTPGVLSLPAGLIVRINHSRPHNPVRYWPPQPRPDWTPLPIRTSSRARTFLREQLEQVVEQHLLSDLPVACFLSSGLDSGILTALASRIQPGGIDSFTVALPGTPQDESLKARVMAQHCGSNHHELVITPDDALTLVDQALTALDVPSADAINTYLVSTAVAGQGIKVALSGLGADELFGGYPSHRLVQLLMQLRFLPVQMRRRLLQLLSPRLASKLTDLPSWDHWHLGLALRRWCSDSSLMAAGLPPLHWPKSAQQRITQAWGQSSWAELFGYTEPMLLRDSDSMTMACGLELRVPFLDHQLVEIALRMPQHFQKPGKALLRESCRDLFPPGYLNRPKQGFCLPMSSWMRGPLRRLCTSRLEYLSQSLWVDLIWIQSQWSAFEAGQINWPRAWSLVVLGEFARRHIASQTL